MIVKPQHESGEILVRIADNSAYYTGELRERLSDDNLTSDELARCLPNAAIFQTTWEMEVYISVYNTKKHMDHCLLYENHQSCILNYFTIRAIEGSGSDRIVHFNHDIYEHFPVGVYTRASAYKIKSQVNKFGMLQLPNTTFVHIDQLQIEYKKRRRDGFFVSCDDCTNKIEVHDAADMLMVELALYAQRVLYLVGAADFGLLQDRIRHRIACCTSYEWGIHYPVLNNIHNLANDILARCEEAEDCSQDTLDGIKLICQDFIRTHNKYKHDLCTKFKVKSVLKYKDNLRNLQEMFNATLLHFLTWEPHMYPFIEKHFLENIDIVSDSKEELKKTLQTVLQHDSIRCTAPIIRYQKMSDIRDWRDYCTYCHTHGILIDHEEIHPVDLQQHPHMFPLINRLIIEDNIALDQEKRQCYTWTELVQKGQDEQESLLIIKNKIGQCINHLCTRFQLTPWDQPDDIDFEKLHTCYDNLDSKIKHQLNEDLKLTIPQIHNYLHLAEFTLESAQLGYYRIPVPTQNGITVKTAIFTHISQWVDKKAHIPILIQRLSYMTSLFTFIAYI